MIRKWGALLLCLIMATAILGCSDANGEGTGKGSKGSLKLPDTFPTDFPFPESMILTRVEDGSEGDSYSFGLRFTFDPNIDLDATFKMYDDYANGLGYNIIIGGEEYFANGIFQFGATSKFSASDMFIVTLKPEGSTFGDIQLKYRANTD